MLTLAGVWAGAVCGGGSKAAEVPLPEATPFAPAVAERLNAIRDGAAEARGLDINETVSGGTLTREQLRAYFEAVDAAVTEDERREIDAFNSALRLLRMIGPDDDALDAYTDAEAEDILGFYSPPDNELVLIGDGTQITEDDEYVLAHEYVHSFQQQAFDIDRLDGLATDEEEDSRTEYGMTASCVQEGDATLSGIKYMLETYGSGWLDRQGETADPEGGPSPDTPEALLRYEMFSYDQCVSWAGELFALNGDFSAIDQAYERPPWTTEQILHPEKYLEREGATGMPAIDLTGRLGSGWERLERSIFGEFDVYNYILTITNQEAEAAAAAAGWGVGWINVYAEKPREGEERDVVVHISLEFDTPEDFGEFGLVYGQVIDVLAPGRATVGEGGKPTCWEADKEYGYVTWDERLKRFDIVIATTAEARDVATAGSLTVVTNGPCAA
jgi:hypothetical protein